MMEIKSAEFVTSAVKNEGLPVHDGCEFMFCGRSNVGKSSLINGLCQRKKLAKTSSTPGKTQTLNVYLINRKFYLIDVPGYGYAQVGKKIQESFGKMIERYVRQRKQLKLVFLLVDFRHCPTENDVLMYRFLKYYHLPVVVVATKSDQVKQKDYKKNKEQIIETLMLEKDDDLVVTSVLKKEGLSAVWDHMEQRLNEEEK